MKNGELSGARQFKIQNSKFKISSSSAFSLTFATFFALHRIVNQLECRRLTILTGYFFIAK
jgi:hypothetical protein